MEEKQLNKKGMKGIALIVLLLSSFCFSLVQAYASETKTLNLSELQALAEKNNPDIQVAYQNLYQARRTARASFLEYLPRLDTILIGSSIDSTLGTLMLIDGMLPNPSEWYRYKENRSLATAEKYAAEVVRLNIRKEIAILYYNILLQQKLNESLKAEADLLQETLKTYEENIDLGLEYKIGYNLVKRDILVHEAQISLITSLIKREMAALYIALNLAPNSTTIELAKLDSAPSIDDLPGNVQTLIGLATDNSPELKQYKFLSQAARYAKRSKQLSFISFSGIGFEYFSEIQIAKSQQKVVEIQRERARNQIGNQVFQAHYSLTAQLDKLSNEELIIAMMEEDLANKEELFNSHHIDFNTYMKARRDFLKDQRRYYTEFFTAYIRKAEITRLLGVETSTVQPVEASDTTPIVSTPSELSPVYSCSEGFRKNSHTLKIAAESGDLSSVASVDYTLSPSKLGTRTKKDPSNGFKFSFKSNRGYNVLINITLKNGDVVTKEMTISKSCDQ